MIPSTTLSIFQTQYDGHSYFNGKYPILTQNVSNETGVLADVREFYLFIQSNVVSYILKSNSRTVNIELPTGNHLV